jgi:ABC-type nitrate/sulfonate/bicarbonate transport system substrate-binding protein
MIRLLLLSLALVSNFASSQTPLRTKVFPGAQALPLMAGVQQKIFERHGIRLKLLFTASSQELRDLGYYEKAIKRLSQ